MQFGRNRAKTFADASRYYLATEAKKSLERDARDLQGVEPWVGHLELGMVKRPTLMPYVTATLEAGKAHSTVARSLRVVRRVLVLAVDEWEWLDRVPLLRIEAMLRTAERETNKRWRPAREGYCLSIEEQQRLLGYLPEHLQCMALFAIHTGARQEEVCGLRWEWLRQGEVWHFDLPADATKGGRRRPLVLNRAGRRIVEGQSDKGVYVFQYADSRVQRMNNTAWRRARKKAKLPRLRVHDLRHTAATRMRDAGVREEDIRDVLGHSGSSVTRLYAAPTLGLLYSAVQAPYQKSTALALETR